VRKISALIVATVVAASLAACSSPTTAADCLTGAPSGDAASLITATGTVSTDSAVANSTPPVVDYPTPLFTKGVEKETLVEGTGQLLQDGDAADVYAWVYDGAAAATTPLIQGFAIPLLGSEDSTLPFGVLAECSTVGSRVVATIETADYPALVPANGVTPGDTLVIVMDITARYLGKANGTDQLPQAGFPSVVLTPEGRPGITIPNATAPKKAEHAVLKAGDGETVKDGDVVVANFTALTWDGKEVFASTWDNAAPTLVTADVFDATNNTTGMVPGLKEAIVGQKVGSQIVVVIPPASGFGDASEGVGVTATDTIVYVFDVLGIQK